MEYLSQLLLLLLVLPALWAVAASPVFLAFFFLARFMRRKPFRQAWAIVMFALAFSLLAAPVPTPIITVFMPHGLALIDRHYYPNILYGPAMFSGLWHWIVPSLLLTFGVILVVAWRYIRPPNNSCMDSSVKQGCRS